MISVSVQNAYGVILEQLLIFTNWILEELFLNNLSEIHLRNINYYYKTNPEEQLMLNRQISE